MTTGTEAADASTSSRSCSNVRSTIASTYLESTLPGVLDRLAAPQLQVVRREHHRMPAQLRDAHLERDPGSGRRLLEDQRHRTATQALGVASGSRLELGGQVEEVVSSAGVRSSTER